MDATKQNTIAAKQSTSATSTNTASTANAIDNIVDDTKNVTIRKKRLGKINNSIKKMEIVYVTEPKNCEPSVARRVKCMVYTTTQDDDGEFVTVRYGACIFRKEKDTDVYKTGKVISTALSRFRTDPVFTTFKLDNKTKTTDVYENVEMENKAGGKYIMRKFVEKSEVPVSREDQIIRAIRQAMCYHVIGGVCGKQQSKKKKEFSNVVNAANA